LFVWGAASQGEIGLNDTSRRSSPVQISGTWISINNNAQGGSALCINSNNELYAWGRNDQGQLGLGDTANKSSPIQVGLLTNWAQTSATRNAAAIKTDATWWTWGYNGDANFGGQLAQNNIISLSSPVQVGSNTFSAVTAGGAFVIATT
jgi:alpha-tubulin suppressor-like RCC1 family protein